MKKKPAREPKADTLVFRQWCIERAIAWPVHHELGYAQQIYSHGGGGRPEIHREEDVIGRANKIRDWVLG